MLNIACMWHTCHTPNALTEDFNKGFVFFFPQKDHEKVPLNVVFKGILCMCPLFFSIITCKKDIKTHAYAILRSLLLLKRSPTPPSYFLT